MLARVVYPLHGFGGIERHVFHLVTHLARLGVRVTLCVQPPHRDWSRAHPHLSFPLRSPATCASSGSGTSEAPGLSAVAVNRIPSSSAVPFSSPSEVLARSVAAIVFLRYDYTSPVLRPNSILGRQLNYPWYSWRLGLTAAKMVRRGEVHLVHSQGLCAMGYGWLRGRDPMLQRVPFVANPHGLEEYRTPDWRKWIAYGPFRVLYSYGHRRADRVIATDTCTRDDVPRYLGVDPARVVVIPSAIDVEECLALVDDATRKQLRNRFALDGAELVLFSVGRLERNKGFHILIEALARIRTQLPARWQWLLVGQGREETRLRRLVHEAGLDGHVQFVGRLADDTQLHSLYREVDLVVHPTLYEGSSLVTLEGMVHQKPVIASRVGGIPDKVFDGQNGYLVEPGSVEDLAHKLTLALAQREQWPAWGEAGMRIVRRSFDWPVVAAQTRSLYETLLNQ